MIPLNTIKVIIGIFLLSMAGCSDYKNNNMSNEEAQKKVDVLYVGPEEGAPSFKKASIGAKAHYDLIRAAREAKETGHYQEAIKIYNQALATVGFKFEAGVIYMNLAEIYKINGDVENEIKYRLLMADHTNNPSVKESALERVEELRQKAEMPIQINE